MDFLPHGEERAVSIEAAFFSGTNCQAVNRSHGTLYELDHIPDGQPGRRARQRPSVGTERGSSKCNLCDARGCRRQGVAYENAGRRSCGFGARGPAMELGPGRVWRPEKVRPLGHRNLRHNTTHRVTSTRRQQLAKLAIYRGPEEPQHAPQPRLRATRQKSYHTFSLARAEQT